MNAVFVLLALMIAIGYRRTRRPSYQITWRDQLFVALVTFAALFTGMVIGTMWKFPPHLAWPQRITESLVVIAIALAPLATYLVIVWIVGRRKTRT